MPADSSDDWDLANYAKGGLDAIDFGNLLSQKSEIYPIYPGKDLDDSGQSSLLNEPQRAWELHFLKPGNTRIRPTGCTTGSRPPRIRSARRWGSRRSPCRMKSNFG